MFEAWWRRKVTYSFGFVFSYGSRRIILKEGHVARSVYYILSGEGLCVQLLELRS